MFVQSNDLFYAPEPEGIDIEKSTNGEDADEPPGRTLAEGAPVNWTYVVTNTGVQMLTQLKLQQLTNERKSIGERTKNRDVDRPQTIFLGWRNFPRKSIGLRVRITSSS